MVSVGRRVSKVRGPVVYILLHVINFLHSNDHKNVPLSNVDIAEPDGWLIVDEEARQD